MDNNIIILPWSFVTKTIDHEFSRKEEYIRIIIFAFAYFHDFPFVLFLWNIEREEKEKKER